MLFQTLKTDDDKMYLISRFASPMKDFHDFYLSCKIIPSGDMPISIYPHKQSTGFNIGIVIYGPVITENKFTLNSIKLYSRLFEDTNIVLTTNPSPKLASIKNANIPNVKIIENNLHTGDVLGNDVRSRILNCVSGLNYLRKHDITHAIVIRSDFRLTYDNVSCYLQNLINYYVLDDTVGDQKSRIIICSKNTLRYIPFCFSNDFQFGHINDLLEYWNNWDIINLINKKGSNLDFKEDNLLRYEVIMGFKYAKYKIANHFCYNLNSYYEFLAQRFVILDNQQLGIIHHNNSIDGFGEFEYDYYDTHQTIGFNDWFLINNKTTENEQIDERYSKLILKIKERLLEENFNFY